MYHREMLDKSEALKREIEIKNASHRPSQRPHSKYTLRKAICQGFLLDIIMSDPIKVKDRAMRNEDIG